MESRLPCPLCGESILPEASICPHCRSDVLFDVWVTGSAVDGRTAYHLARELESHLGPSIGFLTIKHALENAPAIAVPSVTRATADACETRLNGAGISTRIAHHSSDSGSSEVSAPRSAAAGDRPGFGSLRTNPGTTLAVIIGTALAVAVVMFTARERAQHERAKDTATFDMHEVAALAEAATAHLSCGQKLGAGFFVTPNLILTNAHVLCSGNPRVNVTLSDGRKLDGRVARVDSWLDIGLVSVPGAAATPIRLGDATALELGEEIVMMGSPRGLDFTLSRGIVSHPNRVILGVSYVQIDAAVNPGNSGGPLLDRAGHAVGIVSMMIGSASNLGLALPVNYVIAGPEPMLANYDAGYDLERWAARIQAAEEADRVDVAQFRTNANRTGVVGAQLGERGAVVALVIRMSDTRPNDSYLGFSLIRSGAEVCSPSGIASQWQRVTPGLDGEQSSRYLMWLERHGLAREIYASPVHLGMTGCPDPVSIVGATLKLRDGATNADQVVIGSDPMWGG